MYGHNRGVEQERQVENLQRRRDRGELRGRRREHLHRVLLDSLHLVLVAVERRVGVDLDLDAPVGSLLQLLLEPQSCLALGGGLGGDVRELQLEGLILPSAGVAVVAGAAAQRSGS